MISKLEAAQKEDWPKAKFHEIIEIMTLSLNKICFSDTEAFPFFSVNLRASKNYTETYKGQTETINAFLKPAFLIWYHLEQNKSQGEEVLHATIVTPEEAEDEEFTQLISYNPISWLSTPDNTLVGGERPNKILHEERYQSLAEQVRFFSGEFSSFLEQDIPLVWLKENVTEKLDFFKNRLRIYRPGSEAGFDQSAAALSRGNMEGFNYIANHPFEDLRHCDWNVLFPKTISVQAAEYTKVAEAFDYMNEHWMEEDLAMERIQQQFDLPFHTCAYVHDHLDRLLHFKQFLPRVFSNHPFLLHLSEEEKGRLESYLGISLNSFYEPHGLNASDKQENDPKWQLASIEALYLLRNYPALRGKIDSFDCYFTDLARTATKPEILVLLLKVVKPSDTLKEIALKAFDYYIQSPEKQAWEKVLIHIFEKYSPGEQEASEIVEIIKQKAKHIGPILGIHIFRLFGQALFETLFNDLSLKDIIEVADNAMLNVLVDPHKTAKLSEDILILLAEKCYQKGLIEKLLQRNDINDTVLAALFTQDSKENPSKLNEALLLLAANKVNNTTTLALVYNHRAATQRVREAVYQHKALSSDFILSLLNQNKLTDQEMIKTVLDRTELRPEVLKLILNKNLNYENLHKTLTHPKLSETDRQNWLEEMARTILPLTSSNLESKISHALKPLRLKACKHAVKALEDEHYVSAAKTAIPLYQALHEEVEQYLKKDRTWQEFQINCEGLIAKAEPVLKEHRGYAQIIADILNVILNVFTFKFAWSKNWRFFEIKTESMEVLGQFREAISVQ